MNVAIFALCALTSLVCVALLLRAYSESRVRLLLWCLLCFTGLAVNNIVLFVDKVMLPDTDLALVRALPAFLGVSALVYGLVWEVRR
ncbi:MAG: hypothetical protein AVDCRST_MAG85-2748 [uncultured Solirubrobacteraceae bacterium]|uniref:Uncharacterized protein n=1 Tax=uncultured Solirubrobacteraceae bacterium TaxID=1162706 RepID=A0A6J4TAM5_9ACTN|nr:MAG: hypothetical protein AVDCRST_MAG85-2748 [uncultured Solirubrobacteraceae bacterium]